MNSWTVKAAVLAHFRFDKGYRYVSTEVGNFYADVVVSNTQVLIEIEVKVSKSDFSLDFEKAKHQYYGQATLPESEGGKVRQWVPNLFFFAVPAHMEEWALRKLKDNKYYGLYILTEPGNPDCLQLVKPAQPLHDKKPAKKILEKILMRMGSDLCTQYLKGHMETQLARDFQDLSKKLVERESSHE